MLGKKVKDVITGFEGIAIGRCEYVTGCEQILVQPKMKEGKVPEGRWIDVDRLEVTGNPKLALKTSKPGFDMPAPLK